MAVLAGDMNGHVECNNVGYDRTHGGYEYKLGMQMAPGSGSLQMG